jgi:uncharacterized protein YutE (UPF0331/DUF86 family)
MTLPAQRIQDAEVDFLEGERARYEAEGFTFTMYPDSTSLPAFLGSYRPDAIAQRPGRNIAIEVKARSTPATERSLAQIRRLFEGHPDWQLNIALIGSDPFSSMAIAPAQSNTIRNRMNEVVSLKEQGYTRAAFVLAWSLLEAAMNLFGGEALNRPRSPGTLVQALAIQGYIEPDLERRLQTLTELRNRIVHGDLDAEPSSADVDLVLTAIADTLAADAT